MDPISGALIGIGATLAAELVKGVASEVVKHEFYKTLERHAARSSLVESFYHLTQGTRRESLPESAAAPTATDVDALRLVVSEVQTLAATVPGAERVEIARAAEALGELADVLQWFSSNEASKLITATCWLDETGSFRPWTRRPWFADFQYDMQRGRFMLLGQAATWNFNKPFESGEGFMLYLADRFRSFEDLRARLRQYNAGCEALTTPHGDAARVTAQAAVAAQAGLLSEADLLDVRRYVRLVGRLENASEQATLPAELIADLNAGRVARLCDMLVHPTYGTSLREATEDAPKPTLYLDFLSALAAIETSFEAIDAYLRPGTSIDTPALATLVTILKGVRASYLTRGGEMATVIKVKLPLVLRELRATGTISVDPRFCNTPDGHLRRGLKRLHPLYFNNVAGYPALSTQGVKHVEAILGPANVRAIKESPVNATFYEALLVSTLAHAASPTEPFMYDIPLFVHGVSGGAKQLEKVVPCGATSAEAHQPSLP